MGNETNISFNISFETICKLLNIQLKTVFPLREQNNQETYLALKHRVTKWWNSESGYLANKIPIIVSHDSPLNAFISIFDNNLKDYRTFGRGNIIPMGGMWEVNYDSTKITGKLVWLPPFLNDLGRPKFKNIKLNHNKCTEL